MKDLAKKIENVIDSMGKGQSAFAMACNDKGNFFYSYKALSDEIGAGIATILLDWFDDGNKNAKIAAEGIAKGVSAVLSERGEAAKRLMEIILYAVTKKLADEIVDIKSVGDYEDCEQCDHNLECTLPSAVRYRKENGIKSPNKNKNKKRCDRFEKGN